MCILEIRGTPCRYKYRLNYKNVQHNNALRTQFGAKS